ncbi:ABC transporter permease, partial [Kribbella sp.]|uniref:ABC transporter permease n=1 Tax=Kribbella sp. TaxID=1871183 RepID=UPI002D43D27B
MMRLALRTLRYRKSGFLATFVAVVFGTAIVMACGGLMETGIRSTVEPQRLAGADLVLTGKQSHLRPGAEDATPLPERVGVPVNLLPKIRATQGVTSATGDYTFTAIAPAITEGHNWSSAALAPYRLSSGHAPRSGQVVVSSGKVGERLTFLINGDPRTFTVSGLAAGPAGHAFFNDRDAAHLVRTPERFADIGVQVAPGTDLDAVRKHLEEIGNLTVSAGIDRGLAEHPDAESHRTALIAIAGSFGGIAAMTMMFVVASTLALAAQHREREF